MYLESLFELYIPGIISVWHPMMKRTCIGPNCTSPNFFLWRNAKPSFTVKTVQKKQILMVLAICEADRIQLRESSAFASTMRMQFSTTRVK